MEPVHLAVHRDVQSGQIPLSVGVLYLSGAFSFKTRVVAAGAVLTVLPILLVFLFTQRYFLRGFDGAVK